MSAAPVAGDAAGAAHYLAGMALQTENRIGVAAPVEVVWDVLSDLDGWTAWNPLYTRAEGRLLIDAKLSLDMKLPGEPGVIPVQGQVIDWVPNNQIHWREKSLLVETTRYFEIEKLTDTGCIFSNGVLQKGLGVRYPSRRKVARLREGFRVMSEALKARAEAVWAARREAAE